MAEGQVTGIEEIRKHLAAKTIIIGEREVMRGVLAGKMKKVFLAKNCKDATARDILRAKEISGLDVEHLALTNVELGVVCKKPFAVSLLGVPR